MVVRICINRLLENGILLDAARGSSGEVRSL